MCIFPKMINLHEKGQPLIAPPPPGHSMAQWGSFLNRALMGCQPSPDATHCRSIEEWSASEPGETENECPPFQD